ncbi:hypothetical protein ACS0TY_029202 [Phlomoides rotata]
MGSSSDDTRWSSGGISLPEIEAQIVGESVLIKILCEKRKGVHVKILDEVEKMNMSVVSTSLTAFADLTLDNIVVNAEMDKEILKPATKDHIVKTLRSALQIIA